MIKPISISLSPNTEKDDVLLAFKLLFQPWRWKNAENTSRQIEEEFEKYLGVKHAFAFNSGRSSLMAILNSLGLNQGDEVLLQAFTCNAVPNPILWTGLKPTYVDCDKKTFNIDIEDLKRKISPRSRAVIVQHTFGLPADMDGIIKICRQGEEDKSSSSPFAEAQGNNLILIEDCAHALGATYKARKVGTFGKASFFSFSRDKVISSVYGGMVATNDDNLAQKIKAYQEKIGYPSNFWIFQQLLHPVLMNWLILPTYRIFGKYLFVLFQELKILSKAVHWKEKKGEKPDYFPKKLPNALATLALSQFKKLERFNEHRKEITDFYRKELKNTSFGLPPESEQIYLRFTIKSPKAHEIIKKAWGNNLLIGDWYTTPVAPDYTKLEKLKYGGNICSNSRKLEIVNYKLNSCPQAEKLAKETLNLPTHINISKRDAQKIINFLKIFSK